MAIDGEGVEQEVEVHEAPVRPPYLCQLGHGVVVRCGGKAEAAPEVVAGTDVVARENVIAAQPPQQRVLGAPAADSGKAGQGRQGAVVVRVVERLQVDVAGRRP